MGNPNSDAAELALGVLIPRCRPRGTRRSWHAEITTDGPDGLTRTSEVIQAGDMLSVPAVKDGGHVVKLTRAACT